MKYIVVYLSNSMDLYTEEFDTYELAADWAEQNGKKNVIIKGAVEASNN